MSMNMSFQKTFYVIATVIALFVVLSFARVILIPLGLAFLITCILYPVTKKLEYWGLNEMLAAFLSILLFIAIIGGSLLFFSTQIISLSKEASDFQEKLMGLFTDVLVFLNTKTGFELNLDRTELLNQLKEWLKASAGTLAGSTFNSAAAFITLVMATFVYTFLLLIYRKGFTRAFIKFFPEAEAGRAFKMFKNIQQVGQNYLSGMLTLIIILGFANSIGLWIIGIDSPFLFGFLAATLSIIPYVGTTLGATIPVVYAFMSHDALWEPIAVIILFWSVQVVETNFLSPKIVGSRIKVNALAAILSLIIGAAVWGIAGMILFLPFASMLKVICEEFEPLQPVALLIGDQNDTEKKRNNKTAGKAHKSIKDWYHNFQFFSGKKRNKKTK